MALEYAREFDSVDGGVRNDVASSIPPSPFAQMMYCYVYGVAIDTGVFYSFISRAPVHWLSISVCFFAQNSTSFIQIVLSPHPFRNCSVVAKLLLHLNGKYIFCRFFFWFLFVNHCVHEKSARQLSHATKRKEEPRTQPKLKCKWNSLCESSFCNFPRLFSHFRCRHNTKNMILYAYA